MKYVVNALEMYRACLWSLEAGQWANGLWLIELDIALLCETHCGDQLGTEMQNVARRISKAKYKPDTTKTLAIFMLHSVRDFYFCNELFQLHSFECDFFYYELEIKH